MIHFNTTQTNINYYSEYTVTDYELIHNKNLVYLIN